MTHAAVDSPKSERQAYPDIVYRLIARELLFDHTTAALDLFTLAYNEYKVTK